MDKSFFSRQEDLLWQLCALHCLLLLPTSVLSSWTVWWLSNCQ